MNKLTGSFEADVLEMYREVGAQLRPGVASVKIGPSRDPAGGNDIEIVPHNLGSASLFIHVIDNIVYLSLGRSCRSEVFAGSPKRERKAINRLYELTNAVMEGRFSEDIWLVNDKVVKSIGTLTLNDRTRTLRYYTFFNPFRKTRRIHYDYLPYAS